jgi:3-hydroxyisobutyrate dehydrogenase-like beta-hydroxyacid dehydrogenase
VTAVAVIGTGHMGAAMATRIAGAGHVVTVWNRTGSTAAAVASSCHATVASTAAAAAGFAAVIVVSLADDEAVREVYGGEDGLIAGLNQGTVVADTSTVHPATVRSLAPLVGERGAVLLDTPVSGSVPVVERGQITVLAGGPLAALDIARPVLESFASRIFHLGDSGAGATMKLAVNSVVHGLNLSVAEALVLAERAGVARELAYDVFAASVVGAPFVQYKRDAFVHPASAPVAFSVALMAKDYRLIADFAHSVGARMDQLDASRAVSEEAIAAGLGDRDMSAVAELLRRPRPR